MSIIRISFYLCNNLIKCRYPQYNVMAIVTKRRFSSLQLTKNLELISKNEICKDVTNLKLSSTSDRPLVILLAWLLAKQKHMHKFADFYMERGFDVLKVTITPWQMIWPTKGSQVIADEIVNFIDKNPAYATLLIHGFSIGGYLWGEVLVRLSHDPKACERILHRFIGQIWDSAADISEISYGFPVALFPKNKVLQNAAKQYILYHMRTFDKVATCHYVRSSQLFHCNMIKVPALFLVSKSDPIGAEASNWRLKEDWENIGIKVHWQCWDKSPHVKHFQKHRQEYIAKLESFLDDVSRIPCKNKLQAKL